MRVSPVSGELPAGETDRRNLPEVKEVNSAPHLISPNNKCQPPPPYKPSLTAPTTATMQCWQVPK